MKAWKTLGQAVGLEGRPLVLQERDGVFVIRSGGRELMSSARHHSEEAMAEEGLKRVKGKQPVVLIGGLGLGYTVRAALDRLPPDAGEVVVAEISPHVIDWNRGPLGPLAGKPLNDRRVTVELADVARVIAAARERFDAVLLDVDLGPSAMATRDTQKLYEGKGIAALKAALKPKGVLVVWSAGPDAPFLSRLGKAGFEATMERSQAHLGGSASHVLFIATLR